MATAINVAEHSRLKNVRMSFFTESKKHLLAGAFLIRRNELFKIKHHCLHSNNKKCRR